MTTSALSTRQTQYAVEGFFAARWSPRSFQPETILESDLMSIFEAARWAPSSYNNQPWRFLYALRETPEWPLFFDLLVEQNKVWAKDASALILVISNTKFDHNGKDCPTHSFDTGSAWQNLALQAWIKGYITHGMQGLDYPRAEKDLEVPTNFKVEAMIALGKQGPSEALPLELQEREVPSDRRPVSESVVRGKFSAKLLHQEKD